MNILEWILLLLLMLFVNVIVPAIALAVLWDIIAFIIFLATLRSHEEKHKKAENMFMKSSVALTACATLAAVCTLLLMLIYNFI